MDVTLGDWRTVSAVGVRDGDRVDGLLHGHAHGAEMPTMPKSALYSASFLTATALLDLLGIAAGLWLSCGEKRRVTLRVSGAAIPQC